MVINISSPTDLSGFYVVYEGSVRNERPGWWGLSHLMEHLVCKSFDDLQDHFQEDGISWNAYTSDDHICFHFTGLDEYLAPYLDQIMTKLVQFNVTVEQFEMERKIVLEEYKDAFNSQNRSHQQNLYRRYLNNHGPIGLRQDLEQLTYQDCVAYFQLQYAQPTKIINISAHHTFIYESPFASPTFKSQLSWGNYPNPVEINNDYQGKASLIAVSPVISADFAALNFINAMLGSGLKSPLYQEVREKRGLAYYVQCYLDRVTGKQGVINIVTETSAENEAAVKEALMSVLAHPHQHLTPARFEVIKKSYLISLKKQEINRYVNINKWITPADCLIDSIIDTVTLEQLLALYPKYYNFDQWYWSNDQTEKW